MAQIGKFQTAIAAWRTVELSTLLPTLDTTANEIVAFQHDSTRQRKELASKTKDFRKADDATKLADIKGLLKSYQAFIDLLTNHAKSVNATFLKTYSSLSEAPDPYPLLEASVDSMLATEESLPKLTEENSQFQASIAKLTAQLEESEARLQTESTARRELETTLDTKLKEVESSWQAALGEKQGNWTAKEKALEAKLEDKDRILTEMKATYEVSQRLGDTGGEEDDDDEEDGEADGPSSRKGPSRSSRSVTNAELDILRADLERTGVRLAEVETRNEQLGIELAQAKSQVSSSSQNSSVEDDPLFRRLQSENSSLIRKLDASRIERDSSRRDIDQRLRTLERESASLREERDTLKKKLQSYSDYEEVKQELEVLKSIEFSTGDEDEEGADASSKAEGDGSEKSLEKLLLQRNQKLSDELVLLRVSHQDLQEKTGQIQAQVDAKAAQLVEAQQLVEKLENDLSTLQANGSGAAHHQGLPSSGVSTAGTYSSRYGSGRKNGRMSPTSSIISGLDPRMGGSDRDSVFSGASHGTNVTNASANSNTILPMITAQRDRFKKRNVQLEQELSEAHRTISQLRQEVAALQKDNLKLYERTRFISSFGQGSTSAASPPASASPAYGSNPNPSSISLGHTTATSSSGGPMERYRQTYESNLTPFAAFRGREAARVYKRMNVVERIIYSVARYVLASRAGRNLFALYCLALHVLVLLTIGSVSSPAPAPKKPISLLSRRAS